MDGITWVQETINNELFDLEPDASVNNPSSRVAESSYFKILSCGLGPKDNMVSIEAMFQFESFKDISAKKIGEKFL